MPVVDSKPLVSILVPAYNAERWIRQCLDSAIEQTYPATEIIVVDDGSTDGTVDVVRKYEGRVRLVAGKHAGGNAARNQLLAVAQGEWLQFLDSDDYLLPDKLSVQMDRLNESANLDVIYCPVLLLDQSGSPRLLPLAEEDDITLHYLRWGHLNTNAFLFRREALLEVGGWNVNQAACQEHELLYRLVRAGKKFSFVNHAGAVYRWHDAASSVSRKDPLRTLRLKLELLEKMQDYLERAQKLTRQHRKELFAGRMEAARSAWKVDPELARSLAKKARSTGTWWISFSPALPASFQFALRVLGFSGAERLASLMRREHQAQV